MRDRLWDDENEDREDRDDLDPAPDDEEDADELDDEQFAAEDIEEEDLEQEAEVSLLDEDEVDSAEAGGLESFECAFCGEVNEIFIDRTASKHQQFTEDCEVCCRPNLITVFIDPEGGIFVDAEQEYEA